MSDSNTASAPSAVGKRLDALRLERGWSKKQLAEVAEVSRESVHQALAGRASTNTVAKLAAALAAPMEWVLHGVRPIPTVGAWVRPVHPRTRAVMERPVDDDQVPLDEESDAARELADFASEMDRLVRTLSSTTAGELPVQAKIAILNGFEEAARLAGQRLPPSYWAIRKRLHDEATAGGEGQGNAAGEG